ncbi:kinase-like domain-containing protein [Chlamydoabsidia padenii]|nr:kinase-like domain-containing protein [Chlamydoabsidia padenii]
MIRAAYRFRQEHKSKMPSEMETLFDAQDNVYKLRLWTNNKIQYHSFQGDAQYIPPELSTRQSYHCDMVDVWVLGISLYRMLVGKYPFYANNDRHLFNKMQHADFSIPSHLSSDAKDLLRRMLAPETSRASLDLVMFHPWLKPYSVILPSHEFKRSISKMATAAATTTTTPTTPMITSSRVLPEPYHPVLTKKKKSLVNKMIVFIVQGPFPPPKHPYRDLGPKIDV